MLRKWKHVTNHSALGVDEQFILASADLPGSKKQTIRQFCSTEILKRQIFVPFLEHGYSLIRVVLAGQSPGDIGSASDPIELILCQRGPVHNEQCRQDSASLEHGGLSHTAARSSSLGAKSGEKRH